MATSTYEEDYHLQYAMQLSSASVLPLVLKAAIELGVFEIIEKAGPDALLSASDIVAQFPTQNNPEAHILLDRNLCLLASHSILTCSVSTKNIQDGHSQRLYGLAPMAKYFTKNQDGGSLSPFLAMIHDKVMMDMWYHLKDAVLEGGIPFEKAHGINSAEYLKKDARFCELFSSSMKSFNVTFMETILDIYDGFEGVKCLVDVGGGNGSILNMIITMYPAIKGINYDLASVVESSPSYPAFTGDVNALLELIQEDPLTLHAVTVTTSNTPLHVAALLGHAQFAMAAMQNCPGLADELNQQGFSPIHLASAKGHWEIVRDMLIRRPDLALIKDEDGKNPLHTAATKGRVQVLREVFSIASAQELTPKGENALHVAVKHNQHKALETLIQLANQIQVGDELVNAKDEDGNTVLHLACAAKNSKIVKLLVSDQTNVEVNAVNSEGLTALDICVTSMAGSNELEEIQEVLRSAGAEVSGRLVQAVVSNQRQQALSREDRSLTSRNYTDSLRNGIGVLAVLFATLSFQLGMNPPGGSWQDWGSSTTPNFLNVTHKPGKSISWELQKSVALTFFLANAICFFTSLTILVFLALTEVSNHVALFKKSQQYWNFMLRTLFGSLLGAAAVEFITGMALVTDTKYASNICAPAGIVIAYCFLVAFFVLPFCWFVRGRLSR